MHNEKKTYVFYLGIGSIGSIDEYNLNLKDYIETIKKSFLKIMGEDFNDNFIIIPTNGIENKLECINPLYITKTDLIKKHENIMKKLHNDLNNELNDIKEKKNSWNRNK